MGGRGLDEAEQLLSQSRCFGTGQQWSSEQELGKDGERGTARGLLLLAEVALRER